MDRSESVAGAGANTGADAGAGAGAGAEIGARLGVSRPIWTRRGQSAANLQRTQTRDWWTAVWVAGRRRFAKFDDP